MKKILISTLFFLVFLSFSINFVDAGPSDYKTCISCTQNGYAWTVKSILSSILCGSGCQDKNACQWWCFYSNCVVKPSDCCIYASTKSSCEDDDGCCWVTGVDIYGRSTGKCIGKSSNCDKKFCGDFYCEDNKKCCVYGLGGEQAPFAECYNPDTQECLSNGICTRANYIVTVDKSIVDATTQNIPDYTYHLITIENKDSPFGVCPTSTFDLSYNCPSNWKCKLDLTTVTIDPEGKIVVPLRIIPPKGLSAGTYTITVYVTNKRTNKQESVEIKYIISEMCGNDICTPPSCCKEGSCVAEGSCFGKNVCSAGKWIAHCGDGTKNCGEKCESNSDCNSPPDSCYKSSGECINECSNCNYVGPICDGTTCSIGSSDYCNDCTHCGDGKCNCGENSLNCIKDCGGQCISDAYCDDNNPCTIDECKNPATENSICQHNNRADGTDCGDCRECKSGICTYLCKGTVPSCGCVNDKCENCCSGHSLVYMKCNNGVCEGPCIGLLTSDCVYCEPTTSCSSSVNCQGTEASCECINNVCIDCSNYYGTVCGYESCKDDEKPSWSCSNGKCVYNCVYKKDCVTTEGDKKYILSLKSGYNLVGSNAKIVLSDFSNCKLKFIKLPDGKYDKDKPFEGWTQGSKDKNGLYLTDTLEPYQAYLIYVDEDCKVIPSGKVQQLTKLTINEGYNLIVSPVKITKKNLLDEGCAFLPIKLPDGKYDKDKPFEGWTQGSKDKNGLYLTDTLEPYIGTLIYASKGCSITISTSGM